MNKYFKLISFLLLLSAFTNNSFSQKIIEDYEPKKNKNLKIGVGDKDTLAYIQKGYTLMLPESKQVKGVLIFLEDSGFDKKNKHSKAYYALASKDSFAVLSVSSEIPFDFYFSKESLLSTHNLIQQVFTKHQLPNKNIFFLGASLVGHRAMRYIQFIKENEPEFQLNIEGLVICNFTLDFTRKWHQHERDIRINKINLWEPTFINYMLETHLKGTPKTAAESYHNFSAYSYSDEENRNIKHYKNYALRAYIEPAIKYRLSQQLRTFYENNATDIVGFLAELELAGNKKTDLVVFQPDNSSQNKSAVSTWNKIDKEELMIWLKSYVN